MEDSSLCHKICCFGDGCALDATWAHAVAVSRTKQMIVLKAISPLFQYLNLICQCIMPSLCYRGLLRMNCQQLLSALIVLLFAAAPSLAQQASYDFLISGPRIVDGTGSPWFIGDIGITADRIVAIGDLHNASAKK